MAVKLQTTGEYEKNRRYVHEIPLNSKDKIPKQYDPQYLGFRVVKTISNDYAVQLPQGKTIADIKNKSVENTGFEITFNDFEITFNDETVYKQELKPENLINTKQIESNIEHFHPVIKTDEELILDTDTYIVTY